LEIADLKARIESLERLVEKLSNPPPDVPQEAVFRPASPPLPDIGFPDEIPSLTVNQTVVDQYLDWQSYDRTWPHGGNKADDKLDFDGLGESDKENEWVEAVSSE